MAVTLILVAVVEAVEPVRPMTFVDRSRVEDVRAWLFTYSQYHGALSAPITYRTVWR